MTPGSILAGKYRVERVIGTGGMGVILAAKHVDLDQRVAIKVLTAAAARDPDRVRRFSREAKAAARIKSEHVVRVFDFGTNDAGAPFIVMEHLEGSDLAFTLKSRGGLPVEEAVDYILQACDGVGAAHQIGIIHRDLKPANLFLTHKKDGVEAVKVLDFGASKLTAESSLAVSDGLKTHESLLIGSPRYMAPEQLKASDEIDHRVDVYALGATLFELLEGQPVFQAESISRTFTKILSEAPRSLRAARPDVPPGLESAIFRALAKNPAERFQSVKELAEALAPFAPARSKRRPARKLVDRADRVRRGGMFAIGVSLGILGVVMAFVVVRQQAVAAPARPASALVESTLPAPVLPDLPPPPEAEATPSPPARAILAVRRPSSAGVSAPGPDPRASSPKTPPPSTAAGDFSEFGNRK